MYLGEYPLSYAASLDLMDCYKLLRTNKADPNLKDTNGNTVLHMTVIHERLVITTPCLLDNIYAFLGYFKICIQYWSKIKYPK
jgi:ankyrin repeat protein